MSGEQYCFGPFHLDVAERELRRDGEVIALTAKTFDLLLLLLRGAGRTFTKSELLESLWSSTTVEENNLSQTIFLLRKALGENGEASEYILTVPRRGYKFIGKVSQQGPTTRVRWLWPSIGAVAVLVSVWCAVLWMRRTAPVDFSSYRFQPFAYAPGRESHGTWSPDGKSVAFLQGGSPRLPAMLQSRKRLMVQPFEGGNATSIADDVDVFSQIAWSPDGARVYFCKMGDVYSVSRAGGPPELVLRGAAFFDLSPDGKSLALWRGVTTADGVRGSVWISSPLGAQPREYTPAPFALKADIHPVMLRFSPNGKLLYVSMYTLSNTVETWLLPFPPDTGSPRSIFGKVPWQRPVEAAWMPDDRHLVLSAAIAPSTSPALWLADTRDESLTKLTDGSSQQEEPAVSPDGRRLLFTRVEEDADIVELPLNGSAPRKLLATSTSEYSPAWSPKGGAFAYLTRRNGNEEMWLRSSLGDWERPVVTRREFPGLGGLVNPAISPDGSRIVYWTFLRDPSRRPGSVYVSPTAGGTPTWVAEGGAPSWSPDGEFITFIWSKRPPGVLATLRVGSNQTPFEIPNVSCTTSPVWAPSGEWIACGTAAGPMLVSPDGKVRRTLPNPESVVLAWSNDSETLYGLRVRRGDWSLFAEQVRSGAIRTVADYGSDLTPYSSYGNGLRLSLSPDGKSFAIGTLKSQWDLWILDGFAK